MTSDVPGGKKVLAELQHELQYGQAHRITTVHAPVRQTSGHDVILSLGDDLGRAAPAGQHKVPREAGDTRRLSTGGTPDVAVRRYSERENPHAQHTRLEGVLASTTTLTDGSGAPIGSKAFFSGFPATQVFLQPVAAPQALGMAAWASAAFVFAAWLADWFGDDTTGLILWPFLVTLGIAQFAAGMWAFRARDTMSSVVHSIWSAFWLAVGIHYALNFTARGIASSDPETLSHRFVYLQAIAIWLIPVAAVTWVAAAASLARDLTLTLILSTMATGSTLAVIGWLVPSETVVKIGAYFWIVGALFQAFRLYSFFMAENKKHNNDNYVLPLHHHRGSAWRADWERGFARPDHEPGVSVPW